MRNNLLQTFFFVNENACFQIKKYTEIALIIKNQKQNITPKKNHYSFDHFKRKYCKKVFVNVYRFYYRIYYWNYIPVNNFRVLLEEKSIVCFI